MSFLTESNPYLAEYRQLQDKIAFQWYSETEFDIPPNYTALDNSFSAQFLDTKDLGLYGFFRLCISATHMRSIETEQEVSREVNKLSSRVRNLLLRFDNFIDFFMDIEHRDRFGLKISEFDLEIWYVDKSNVIYHATQQLGFGPKFQVFLPGETK